MKYPQSIITTLAEFYFDLLAVTRERTRTAAPSLERLEAAGLAAVAGFHVDVEDERLLVGLEGAQAATYFAGS